MLSWFANITSWIDRPPMNKRTCDQSRSMALPLPLPEDLVEQVLLRFPPDDPASLVRAALVCKSWCRLVSGTAFRRRFGEFHRGAAPLLGVLNTTTKTTATGVVRVRDDDDDDDDDETDRRPMKRARAHARILPEEEKPIIMASSFVPATSYRLANANRNDDWLAMDAHHGRVLLCRHSNPLALSVWDPLMDEQRDLPEVPLDDTLGFSAAVACAAAAGGGGCDHLDCCHRRGPFLVVAIEVQPYAATFSVYSSESGSWSNPTDLKHDAGSLGTMKHTPGVLVGTALCFLVRFSKEIVMFDLATQQVATIDLPSEFHPLSSSEPEQPAASSSIVLMTGDDGELGFVASTRHQLKLWSLVPGEDGVFVPRRVIDLHQVLPSDCSPRVCGFADCGDSRRRFLFIRTSDGLYSIDVNSSHVRKLANRCGDDDEDQGVVPYISFCTPTSKYNTGPASCSADARPTTTTVADSPDGGLWKKIVPRRRRPRTQNPRFYGPEWANN